jgi:hypothetical protein
MRLALTDLYRARWTDQIHDEWTRNLIAKRPDLTREHLDRTRMLMNTHVRESLVSGYEHLIPAIELPDADDRHVVAAAIHAGAETIVTFNLKDFPNATLNKFDIEAIHPDDFIVDLWDLSAGKVLEAVSGHRASLKNPPKSAVDYLNTLAAQSLTKTVALLTPMAMLI